MFGEKGAMKKTCPAARRACLPGSRVYYYYYSLAPAGAGRQRGEILPIFRFSPPAWIPPAAAAASASDARRYIRRHIPLSCPPLPPTPEPDMYLSIPPVAKSTQKPPMPMPPSSSAARGLSELLATAEAPLFLPRVLDLCVDLSIHRRRRYLPQIECIYSPGKERERERVKIRGRC